jgi:hypothetical protein
MSYLRGYFDKGEAAGFYEKSFKVCEIEGLILPAVVLYIKTIRKKFFREARVSWLIFSLSVKIFWIAQSRLASGGLSGKPRLKPSAKINLTPIE